MAMKDNTFRWSSGKRAPGKPPKVEISTGPSLDPGEMVVNESGTIVEGSAARTLWVHAATINGKVVKEAPLLPEGPVGTRPTGTSSSGASRR
jgi:hypothetical protein